MEDNKIDKIKNWYKQSKIISTIKIILKNIIKIITYSIYQLCYNWKIVVLIATIFGICKLNKYKELSYNFFNHEFIRNITFYQLHKNIYIPLYVIEGLALLLIIISLLKYLKLKDLNQKKIEKINTIKNDGNRPYFTFRNRLWLNLKIAIWYWNMNGIGKSKFKTDEFKEEFQSSFNRTLIDVEEIDNRKDTIKISTASARYNLPKIIELDDDNLDYTSSKFILGENLKGKVIIDISKTPHLLIGGITGSGKSVLIDSLIYQAIKKGYTLRICDPKQTEFNNWNNLTIITNSWLTKGYKVEQCKVSKALEDALNDLKEIEDELNKRNIIFSNYYCKNIDEYNKKMISYNKQYLPLSHIIYIFDEIVELSITKDKEIAKEIENILTKIATRGRSAGVHLILSTQRPDCDLLKGQIKSNLDVRICGRTADKILSEVVLGKGNYDADTLISKEETGLFVTNNGKFFRGYLLDTEKITNYLKKDQEIIELEGLIDEYPPNI